MTHKLLSTALRPAFIAAIALSFSLPSQSASMAPAAAEHGMVVSAQHLATRVGVDVLRKGGNAVDAAVAVGYALAVVYPAAGNLGGGGFMTIQRADGSRTFLDFREKAPLAASRDMFLGKDGNVVKGLSTKGFLAVAGKPMRLLVQGVGSRFRQGFDRPWAPGEERRGRLVVIGEKGIDRDAIAVDIGA